MSIQFINSEFSFYLLCADGMLGGMEGNIGLALRNGAIKKAYDIGAARSHIAMLPGRCL